MDLIVVDGDCTSLWNDDELKKLLGCGKDCLWYFDDKAMREHGYNIAAAAGIKPGNEITKGILITKAQNGIMAYHKNIFKNTAGCKYWIISVLDEDNENYRKQIGTGLDFALKEIPVRYELIFDNSDRLELTAEEKKEIADTRPCCVIATKHDKELAERVQSFLAVRNDDWKIECHVDFKEDSYKHTDVILIVGRENEDYLVTPTAVKTSRVLIWIDLPAGKAEKSYINQRAQSLLKEMNKHGWNITNTGSNVLGSCLNHEFLLAELESGRITAETLRSDDDFVMWDKYGLPLADEAYRNADFVESFLREHCCLIDKF